MITYFTTAAHAYTMSAFLAGWGEALAVTVKLQSYDDCMARPLPSRGTYIFTDHERLTPSELQACADRADEFIAAGCRVLNHPACVLSRYALLRKLHAQDANRFSVYRPSVDGGPLHYPVFLRTECGHEIISDLLHSQEELHVALRRLQGAGLALDDVLVVEFCDTADANSVYRKYAAYIIGDRIVPNSISFSQDWMVKFVEVSSREEQEEVWEYMYANPHAEYLRDVCALAGIQYGRIDYAVLDGEPQIWEINTNPVLLTSSDWDVPISLERKKYFARGIVQALEALDEL